MIEKIDLKQHTPMIHFQYESDGVTLRASDLKPRLDKYICMLKEFGCIDSALEEKAYADFKKALDDKKSSRYALSVNCEKVVEHCIKERGFRSLYFGDIKTMCEFKGLSLTVRSFDTELINLIKKALPIMFAYENFGTRNNKGYGSFAMNSDANIDECERLEDIYRKYNNSGQNKIYYLDCDGQDIHKIFTKIYYLYNTLKSGVNESRGFDNSTKYSKSLLWQYLRENKNSKLVWEKRLFKQQIKGDFKKEFKQNDNQKYIRCLLGLTNNFAFRKTRRGEPARMDIDYNDRERISIFHDSNFSLSSNTKNIERAASPLLFKPIKLNHLKNKAICKYRIYIIANPEYYFDNDVDIRKESFLVEKSEEHIKYENNKKIKESNKKGWNDNNETINLNTVEDFDLNEFMKWAVNKINNQKSSDSINTFVKDIKIHPVS